MIKIRPDYEPTQLAIIGYGGFAREVYHHMINDGYDSSRIRFYVDKEYADGTISFPLEDIDFKSQHILVAIGSPKARADMVARFPWFARYFTYVHSSVIVLDKSISIGKGSIICAGSILTTNISLGDHTHLNLNTTIGHDCNLGNFFTTAPAVNISGNVTTGERVYFGTNSSCREKISICDDVTIGLNAGAVKDITVPGTYVGTPCKLI